MKKSLFWIFVLSLMVPGVGRAELTPPTDGNTIAGTSSESSDEVDLSDVDTDAPVQSPSLENTTPAGQAPGQPIES